MRGGGERRGSRRRGKRICEDVRRGKNTYARNWRLEGHLLEGGVFSGTYDMLEPISPRATLDSKCHSSLVN